MSQMQIEDQVRAKYYYCIFEEKGHCRVLSLRSDILGENVVVLFHQKRKGLIFKGKCDD